MLMENKSVLSQVLRKFSTAHNKDSTLSEVIIMETFSRKAAQLNNTDLYSKSLIFSLVLGLGKSYCDHTGILILTRAPFGRIIAV